jgi:hypothetical protein
MKGKGTREGSKGKERVVGGRVKGMSGLPQASDIQKWSPRSALLDTRSHRNTFDSSQTFRDQSISHCRVWYRYPTVTMHTLTR